MAAPPRSRRGLPFSALIAAAGVAVLVVAATQWVAERPPPSAPLFLERTAFPSLDSDLVLTVVDRGTRRPLPGATFEPSAALPREPRRVADALGRIRLPRALLAEIHRVSDDRGSLVSEPEHRSSPAWEVPVDDPSPPGTTWWAGWDQASSATIGLRPLAPTWRRTRVRILGEDGRPRPGVRVYVRGPSTPEFEDACESARCDADGFADVLAPPVAELSAWEAGAHLRDFIFRRGESADPPRAFRVPSLVPIRVRVSGVPTQDVLCWLREDEEPPVRLDPDERLGFARIDDEEVPGWRAFFRHGAEAQLVARADGPKGIVFDFFVPSRSARMLVIDPDDWNYGYARVPADGPVAREFEWSRIVAPPGRGARFHSVEVRWALTRPDLEGR